MDYSLHIKMAEGGRTERKTERRVASRRAQVLLDPIKFFENRRRGRAGIPLPNSMRAPHDGNRDVQEVGQSRPCGRAQALDMLVPGPRGRGRGLFPPTPAILQTSPPRPVGPVAPFTPLVHHHSPRGGEEAEASLLHPDQHPLHP